MQEEHRKIRLPKSYFDASQPQTRDADSVLETRFDSGATDGAAELPIRFRGYQPEAADSSDAALGAGVDFADAPLYLDDASLPFHDAQRNTRMPPASGAVFLPEIPDMPAAQDAASSAQAQRAAASPRTPQQPYRAQQQPYRAPADRTVPQGSSQEKRRGGAAVQPDNRARAQQPSAGVPVMAHTPQHAANAPHGRSTNPKANRNLRADAQAAPHRGSKKTKPPQKKKKHRILKKLIGLCACLLLLCSGAVAVYLPIATRNDFLWLDLAQLPHREATVLYAQSGEGTWQEYARLTATQQKQWVDLENIPADLQHAFVAIEDQNFYQHHGVSLTRTAYAVLNEVKHALTGTYFGGENGIKQGASTIDQQLIKNLTYDNDAGGFEGYLRKIREIYRAYKMDADYEKDAILEAYLNVISFTGNTAGVQAESLKLFGKTVDALSLEQCASIASITKNPYRYDPVRNEEKHLTRRNYILYEMWQQKYITQEQYNTACAQPVGLAAGDFSMPEPPITSYFTDQLIEDVSDGLSAEYGLSRAETTNLLYNGGLRIYTTVDANLQGVMEQNMKNSAKYFPQPAIDATVPVRDGDGNPVKDENGKIVTTKGKETPQAAMVSVGYDGGLKAVVGGLGEKEISRGFNRGTDAVRQVGSTMKPIGAYALALDKNRITWSTPLMDAPVRKIEDEATGEKREWPANFTKTYSNDTMLVADALAQSINTIAVRVGERAGIRSIYNFTRTKLDITSFTSADRAAGPMVLGSSTYGVTPYELAGAYMMFGNGGTHTTLHSFTDVQTGTGRSVLQPEITTQQVIDSDTAYVMNRLLKGVMQGEGTGAGYSVQGNMESIGKTGTTSDNRDYWFVGLTPYYVTATWYGYDSGAALNTSMGTHAPTTAWRAVMQQTQRDMPEAQFPTDATVMMADYCTESGGLATAGCPRTRTGYYRAGTQPGTCILHAA
ncbi:MAG: transglycosylase domain-containing protein [Ruthenibacterium sp.]